MVEILAIRDGPWELLCKYVGLLDIVRKKVWEMTLYGTKAREEKSQDGDD